MKNRDRTGQLSPLLGRYGLDAPLPPEVRERIAADYGRVYRKISEKTSRPTVIAALAAWLFFLVKKAGIPVPVAKFTAAAVAAVSIGVGAYVAMNAPGRAPVASPGQVKYTVTVRPFASSSLDEKTEKACAGALMRALDAKYGRGFARLASGKGIGDAPWAVFGSVEKSGGSAVMIVKIVDARTSRTVFMAEEKCDGPAQCGDAAARMTKKFPPLKHR